MPDLKVGPGALIALLLFIAASVWLGALAHRVVQRGGFTKGYFLGNRGLGAWAVALTATVQSGGTFMGFPSLVYSHGWILTLWIGSYMVVPLIAFGVLGKRMAKISRATGAITVPDMFRERFASPAAGLVASLFILFFMVFMLVAQFKAGALVMKVTFPWTKELALTEQAGPGSMGTAYYAGLIIFAVTVVGYTLIGGFLAAVWTDLFQSVMMLIGVIILLVLALSAVGGLEQATTSAVQNTGGSFASGPGYSNDGPVGAGGVLQLREFLPVGLAVSFFFVWVFGGLGSPATMVRVMACKNTETLRRSIFVLAIYNFLIYIPLIIICICARALMPDLSKSDEVIPRMALVTTQDFWGGSFLAGLILAAPFGAIMATVSSYLVVIASGVVRDIYQHFINPHATERQTKRLTYAVMILVGAIAVTANLYPVDYLQALVVFSGTGAASCFVVPAFMAAYWKRATAAGALAAVVAGAAAVLSLFLIGWIAPDPLIGQRTSFRPYFLLGLEPVMWGLLSSLTAGIVVSLCTKPPDKELVARLFGEGHDSTAERSQP
jgi:SSS family solute:Na+ symporter/sodium/pantothenate symporter